MQRLRRNRIARIEIPLGTSLKEGQAEGPAPPDFHSKSAGEVVQRPLSEFLDSIVKSLAGS